jgi:hypothetical protein
MYAMKRNGTFINIFIGSVLKAIDTDDVIEQSAHLERFHCKLSCRTEHKYTGVPQFGKVIHSMKPVHMVRICKLKITFPCTLHVKDIEFMNESCLLELIFFCNPILFAICTSTFSKLCKNMYTVACRRVLSSAEVHKVKNLYKLAQFIVVNIYRLSFHKARYTNPSWSYEMKYFQHILPTHRHVLDVTFLIYIIWSTKMKWFYNTYLHQFQHEL